MLEGKKGIVFGIRSARTIGWAIARSAYEHGARLCLSYRGERERQRAQELAASIGGAIALPCDVSSDADIAALYDRLGQEWGTLDFVVHSVAFAPAEDMHAGMIGTSRGGFTTLMDVSAYSLAAVVRGATPLMTAGGSVLTMTYAASERVVPVYGPMGPAKAALECMVRYLAWELGPRGIRCNAISAGPVSTPAARGIPQFSSLLRNAQSCTPLRRNVELHEIASAAIFLLGDLASAITGEIVHVDCGMHII